MIWMLIGYMYLFIHRPFEIWPALGPLRIELVYMLLVGTMWLFSSEKRWRSNPQHTAFFGFAASIFLCWLASPWDETCYPVVDKYFKLLVFYVMLVSVVQDEESLKRVLLGFLAIMALYMVHSLWAFYCGRHQFRMGIVRLIGVDETLGEPNAFGGSVLYSLVFVLPLWQSAISRRVRLALVGYVLLSITCIGLTGSRGAFVGLVLYSVIAIAYSKHRWTMATGALLLAPLLFAALPASLQTRFETIIHPEVGPANAQVSAEGRIHGLLLGVGLWEKYPLTGCGPGAWRPATGSELESHNLYGQVMGEMGTVGVLALLALVAAHWLNARAITRAYRAHPEWERDFIFHLSRHLAIAYFLLLFQGNFGHNLFRFNWLWFGGFMVIARQCVDRRLLSRAAAWSPWPAAANRVAWRSMPFGHRS